MKKAIVVLIIAILLPLSAFAGRKKQAPQPDSTQQQDGTDWLNAPTPDGSPTLKETRDWLKRVLEGYGGYDYNGASRPIEDVQIDGKCNFAYKERYIYKLDKQNVIDLSVVLPLGAVTNVSIDQGYPGEVVLRLSTGQASAIRQTQERKDSYTNSVNIFLERVPEAQGQQDQVPQTPNQMAPRVIGALEHAAELCRSVYKVPTQPKEPF